MSSLINLKKLDKQSLILRICAIIVVMILLVFLFYFLYQLFSPQRQYTQQAGVILDQISAHQDIRGFYGDYQNCIYRSDNKYDCTLSTRPNLVGTAWASEYETLAVIWARYHYYLRTKDKSQLEQVKQDLSLFHTTLMEHAYVADELMTVTEDVANTNTDIRDDDMMIDDVSVVADGTQVSSDDDDEEDILETVYVDDVFEFSEPISPQEAHPEDYITIDDITYPRTVLDETHISTNHYNCLFMQALTTSPHLDHSYRRMARDICNYLPFAFSPLSALASDGHDHFLTASSYHTYLSSSEQDQEDFYTEQEDYYTLDLDDQPLLVTQSDLPTLNSQLTVEIDQMLQDWVSGAEPGFIVDYPHHAQTYLTDQLFAAVDHTAKLEVNRDDQQLYDNVLFDYLILTQETLMWARTDGDLDSYNACLLAANLTYYLDHISHAGIDRDKLSQLLANTTNYTSNYTPSCLLAQKKLAKKDVPKKQLAEYLNERIASQLADHQDGTFNYSIYTESLGAGLLSW